jgi:hypothetical protein
VYLTSRLRAHAFGDKATPLRELYTSAIVIDSLCAPFADMDAPPAPDALAAVRQSGITAVNFHLSLSRLRGQGLCSCHSADREGKFGVYSLLSSV